ncbi:Uncharacterized protein PECH_002077 [Penicillium ucsense]|uniref:Glutamyl-tRNA amidotransferase complex subunit Gta3 domain-containing protein n=1 Tax=Penicillium ucsense TaxID=2839758 RepID=A0A8J8WM10_9EURO|nr:Uncharacterized protein PECM_002640 [Penicillium ucsense]KAF7738039.1 Uncharacterized protein PECH_002077 [Penicillium ucsense]
MAARHSGTGLLHAASPSAALARRYSSKPQQLDIASILAQPTWSVRSLLPEPNKTPSAVNVTPQKLRHLLRLSALPQPSSPAEEQSMLKTLESQIHFVQEMQKVDTSGVEPLRSIRDESPAAVKETTITLDLLRDAFAQEHISGRRRRVQRLPKTRTCHPEADIWNGNALDFATKKMGPYFVVDTKAGQSP